MPDTTATYAQTVTRLVREYRAATAVVPMPLKDFNELTVRLHAAADRAGIARDIAEDDFTDECDAEPVAAVAPCGHCDCPGCSCCEMKDSTPDGQFCLCEEMKNHVPSFGPA